VAGESCFGRFSIRRSGIQLSHDGRYQLASPSSAMADGTMIVRTSVASRKMATASPKPICCSMTRRPEAKPAKTTTMITAAPVMMRAVEVSPTATDS
jgi:hypothetical protein